MEAQAFSVKRAQVEFHNFASLGEPERVLAAYALENRHRAGLIRKHLEFIGEMSPFVEIGANAGHSSYMLANEFGASGFALDISADALRWGSEIQRRWNMERAPMRVAGDALHLPFRDGSVRSVLAFQMLSQFMDIEQVFLEVKRILAPGGIFFFAEEPLLRVLSLRLYRCPYQNLMKPWERKLFDWGLLGYLVRDVIGASQEEGFGIRQNHTMTLKDWHALVTKHFAAHAYDMFVPERGWGETIVKKAAVLADPYRSVWRAARLLGGTLTAVCRKEGAPARIDAADEDSLFACLRCPDCGAGLARDAHQTLFCGGCGYEAPAEDGVYNLLPSPDRSELYPGDRDDIIDVSRPGHESRLNEGWGAVEGVYGNKYRWIGPRATARLALVKPGPQRLRVRGHAPEAAFAIGPVRIGATVNGVACGEIRLERPGLFVYEADVEESGRYEIEIAAAPVWNAPGDARDLTVNLSMIRLVPRD
jgi:ubiquinone/menaquinone biosynthesis C-methylase UbiE